MRALGWAVCELADRQHGVVTRAQLVALGFSHAQIRQRVKAGWLHEIHFGVYAVGRTHLDDHGRWFAAVAACGDEALLSHGSAAALWRLVDPISGPVHVSAPHRRRIRAEGLLLHRTRRPLAPHRRRVRGIPVTSVSRTLLDLAAVAPPSRLRAAVEAAQGQRRLNIPELVELCEQASGVRGSGRLLNLISAYRPLPDTRSPTEDLYLRLCDRAGIPRPAVNVPIGAREVDCYWPGHGVVVELDAYGTHGDPASFEADRRRDNEIQLRGLIALRFTRERVLAEPDAVIAETVAALAAARRTRAAD